MTVPQVEYKGKHITGKFLEQSAISSQPFWRQCLNNMMQHQ